MALELDPKKTALVLIDLQTGILGMNLAPHDGAQILANGIALAKKFAERGGTVVLVRVAFADDHADTPNQNVDAPMPRGAAAPPGDWSTFPPAIAALHSDVVITKRQWGAFHGTELDLQLRRRGITGVVLGGIATNFGVESTAREAWQHHYSVVLAEDACTSVSAEMHAFAVEKILPRVSRIRKTAEILAALDAP